MAKKSNKNTTHKEPKKKSEEQKNNSEEPKNNFYSLVNTVEIEMKEHHERDARFVDKKLCFPWDCRKNGSFYKVFDCWKRLYGKGIEKARRIGGNGLFGVDETARNQTAKAPAFI